MLRRCFLFLILLGLASVLRAESADGDLVIADFNHGYGGWTAEGGAFGEAPAAGTLDCQLKVDGFVGEGLVNSYLGGDGTVGTLTSPPFTIQRAYINFLIGGGGDSEDLYMALIVDGKEVLRAAALTWGNELLRPAYWDVRPWAGKEAVLKIVDTATGRWGHINVDEIVQSDRYRGTDAAVTVPPRVEKVRVIEPKERFLLIPGGCGNKKTKLRVEVDGQKIRDIDLVLARSQEDIHFFGTLDVSPWKGKKVALCAEHIPENSEALDWIIESNEPADMAVAYNEKYRPQFHFAPRRGWMNDPNGLVWDGEKYHLFFQHNPFSVHWWNMSWGHATSTDLFHWQESYDAICPDQLGDIFSGSVVLDRGNSSGLAPEGTDPLIAFYTSYGPNARPAVEATQSMAWSIDKGATWTKYEDNPVVKHILGGNRDPMVFRYEPDNIWIMALYLDGEQFALLRSDNLLRWEQICEIGPTGFSELPDIFELPVDGDKQNKKWVFWGPDGNYIIGTFDGKSFTRQEGPYRSMYGGNDYSGHSFSGLPDDRRVQIAWMKGGLYPGMPFNQQFSIPRELTLKSTADGIRLAFAPVHELETLRREQISLEAQTAEEVTAGGLSDCFDAELSIDVSNRAPIEIAFSSTKIEYDPAKGLVNGILPLVPVDGKIKLRLVVDRMSYELFAADGLAELTQCFVPTDEALVEASFHRNTLTVRALESGKTVTVDSADIWLLDSVWK
ncbi:MAG: glycoside hydrolase family 32 protein [Thermoguttaceae bacterium]|nr:glycoside hydrolase family 32 protein [Thermoguttaceae bacterium]